MATRTERLNLPIPELLDAVNREFFELLVLSIEKTAASIEDMDELKVYLREVFNRIDKSIQDSMLDYNIITSEGYKGSQPILDQVLKKVREHLTTLQREADRPKGADEIIASKRYGKAKSNSVEAHLQAFDATMKEIENTILKLSSTDISHGSGTVSSTLNSQDRSIKDLERTIGSGLNADNIKTKRSYQGSERNVEDALRAINAKIDSGSMDTSKVLQEINDLIKDLQNTTEMPIFASGIKTTSSYQGGSKDVEGSLSAIDRKLKSVDGTASQNKSDIDRINKILGGSGGGGSGSSGLTSGMIKHSSENLKAGTVEGALEELFTYADDVHSKWASSIGSPLTKEMTASEKEKATKKLFESVDDAFAYNKQNIDKVKTFDDIVSGIKYPRFERSSNHGAYASVNATDYGLGGVAIHIPPNTELSRLTLGDWSNEKYYLIKDITGNTISNFHYNDRPSFGKLVLDGYRTYQWIRAVGSYPRIDINTHIYGPGSNADTKYTRLDTLKKFLPESATRFRHIGSAYFKYFDKEDLLEKKYVAWFKEHAAYANFETRGYASESWGNSNKANFYDANIKYYHRIINTRDIDGWFSIIPNLLDDDVHYDELYPKPSSNKAVSKDDFENTIEWWNTKSGLPESKIIEKIEKGTYTSFGSYKDPLKEYFKDGETKAYIIVYNEYDGGFLPKGTNLRLTIEDGLVSNIETFEG